MGGGGIAQRPFCHWGGSEIDEKNVTKFDAKVFNDRIASEVLKGALHTQNELYFKAPV